MIKTERILFWLKLLNILDLLGITLVMVIAFGMQFVLNELPCPLCLLQRLGLLAMGFGFLLNVHYHIRPAHYSVSLLAAVFTALVSLRQICLHVLPDSGGYGSTVFGLHMYTWVFILAMLAIIYIAVAMSFFAQYVLSPARAEMIDEAKTPWIKKLSHLAFALFFAVVLANIVCIFLECGLHECPDNPVHYMLFSH